MTNEQLLAEIARLEQAIRGIQAQIAQADADAAQYRMDAQQAEQRRHAAEADRVRIEGKISGLADSVEQRLALQREMMMLKAMSVLAACEMMVNDLRGETNVRFDLVDARMDSMDRRMDSIDMRADSVDLRFEKLDKRLNEVRDTTTGLLCSIETVTENLFELHRDDALTAQAYDVMELPAFAYDEYMLCALDYDMFGKLLLSAHEVDIDPISASEYDALQLTAAAFEAYGLSCARYDYSAKALLR